MLVLVLVCVWHHCNAFAVFTVGVCAVQLLLCCRHADMYVCVCSMQVSSGPVQCQLNSFAVGDEKAELQCQICCVAEDFRTFSLSLFPTLSFSLSFTCVNRTCEYCGYTYPHWLGHTVCTLIRIKDTIQITSVQRTLFDASIMNLPIVVIHFRPPKRGQPL